MNTLAVPRDQINIMKSIVCAHDMHNNRLIDFKIYIQWNWYNFTIKEIKRSNNVPTIQFNLTSCVVTSCQGVVEDRDDNEDNVDGGEAGEQEVEGVLHVSAGQHHDGDDVAEDAEHAHDRLVTQKYN